MFDQVVNFMNHSQAVKSDKSTQATEVPRWLCSSN
jgi:hypothetical protein